jgi:hypothetical protein
MYLYSSNQTAVITINHQTMDARKENLNAIR